MARSSSPDIPVSTWKDRVVGYATVADLLRPLAHRDLVPILLQKSANQKAEADASRVETFGDLLDAHWPQRAVALARQAEDQPHGLGLDGVDLQGLLDAVAALLGIGRYTSIMGFLLRCHFVPQCPQISEA